MAGDHQLGALVLEPDDLKAHQRTAVQIVGGAGHGRADLVDPALALGIGEITQVGDRDLEVDALHDGGHRLAVDEREHRAQPLVAIDQGA